ncbi:hypothetical protein HYDPIDRAFT_112464 [Hydnomerulius pinastri MD-312]|uniref:Uncharacterized protein n=1 Tax=Hydnomerulius pinastri MD-312 TaxID=994086 RepID=A0A0C9VZT0_9AGAM|nr:hypothetical protein HYDPIDRAFT_112464 [Hydnomerulius pinastri MD-312]
MDYRRSAEVEGTDLEDGTLMDYRRSEELEAKRTASESESTDGVLMAYRRSAEVEGTEYGTLMDYRRSEELEAKRTGELIISLAVKCKPEAEMGKPLSRKAQMVCLWLTAAPQRLRAQVRPPFHYIHKLGPTLRDRLRIWYAYGLPSFGRTRSQENR